MSMSIKAKNSTERNIKRSSLYSRSNLPSWYQLFLICTTATVTWTFSCILNGSIKLSNDEDLTPSRQHQLKSYEYHRLKSPSTHPVGEKKFNYSDYTGPSRIFPKFTNPFPCFEGEMQLMLQKPAHEGILFHRPMKTGSTTLTGIVLRLVHNRGQQQYGFDKCKHRSIHGTGRSFEFGKRDKTKSFLFSLIREPQARAFSQLFHFDVSVGLREPTDEYLQEQLLNTFNYMHYFSDLSVRNYNTFGSLKTLAMQNGYQTWPEFEKALKDESRPRAELLEIQRLRKRYHSFGANSSTHDLIKDILDDYDLILIMERMDESLVAFQMLFNLTTKEILYTRARSGGSFSNGLKDRPCVYILPPFKSPGMKKFFASKEWKDHIAPDTELLKAAHKSLDRTIDALGRAEFEEKLALLKEGLKLAAKNCEGRVRTMCSNGGKKIFPRNTTCYFWGEGCDHDCIDEIDI